MNDEWKALLWLVGFLIWMFGTPIVAMYIPLFTSEMRRKEP